MTATNQLSGAEALVRMLQAYGVTHIFGLCGDTSLPLYDALYRIGGEITHVLTRDERSAAYMADAYARVSGRVGVCEGPSGGGATYILPGLAEANESSVPMLAITTDIATTSRGRFALTELDQDALFRPVTKWNRVLDSAGEVPRAVRAAMSAATGGRPGATHIGLPFDVQNAPVDGDDIWRGHAAGRPAPDTHAVEAAASLLMEASAPVFVCGGGVVVSGAEEELRSLAEHIGAAVATSVSGQGSISESHPLAVGVVGSNGGTPETREILMAADLVVFIGCRAGSVTTERWRAPAPGGTSVIHIDIDASVIGVNYPTAAALVGDARSCLAALNARLGSVSKPTGNGVGGERIAEAKRRKFSAFHDIAQSDAMPIRPERLIATLHAALPDDAVIIADPGTPCPYVSAYYEFSKAGRHFISNRAHGALGYGLPAVVGAQLGRPQAKCVAIMGDGGFGFAVGELETIARLNLPVTLIVVSNASFGWIKSGQKSGFGERYFSVDFDAVSHAAVAEAYGFATWTVGEPSDLGPAISEAVNHAGPTLVDVISQPLEDARAPVSEWVA